MYKPIATLLSAARDCGMITTITSNGMLLTRECWQSLAPLVDVLAISIDGRPAEHDLIRRREGAFARTVANLETIRASGASFGFIFTLTQQNVDSLEFIVQLAAEQGAKSVQVHPLTIHGRAATDMPGDRPDGVELVAALVEASRLRAEFGIGVHVDVLTGQQLIAYRDYIVPHQPVTRLVDIAPVLIVEADGSIMPMTHELDPSLRLGSLIESRLEPLANKWLSAGHGEVLADACERTWAELTRPNPAVAVYWYEEVAARTKSRRSLPISA
jgi:MoaA/NifB/PqqE/SkfB family radical SAM enzyme